jgi:long-chain acyl-CoA synthetase
MRNDIAFIGAAYAVMHLGAYAVPVNWHFKPEEIGYVLADSGARVLIGHADVPTPPEIRASYAVDPRHLGTPDGVTDLESWLARQAPYDGPALPHRRI